MKLLLIALAAVVCAGGLIMMGSLFVEFVRDEWEEWWDARKEKRHGGG